MKFKNKNKNCANIKWICITKFGDKKSNVVNEKNVHAKICQRINTMFGILNVHNY